MATFTIDVIINRPVEDVFEYLARPENETQWQSDLVSSRQTSRGAMAVGATGEDERRSMGRRMVTHWTCTAYEPGQRFAFEVTKPMPFVAEYRFESVPDGTRVTMSADPVGFTRLLWPIIKGAGRKRYEANFTALKRVLEAEG